MLFNLKNIIKTFNLKIDGILHIGAHHGNEYKIYNDLNIDNCFFIEPLKHNFDVLIKNVPHELCMNIALGNENKQIEMFVEYNNQSQSSSILEPLQHLIQYPNIKFTSKDMVEMRRLDDVEIPVNFNMINMDVQGYELNVLKGAPRTLEKVDIIITEVNRAELYKDCCMVEDLDTFLNFTGFQRVFTSWDGGTWGDALYIKKGKI
jgi:FkbM family methyltransferase